MCCDGGGAQRSAARGDSARSELLFFARRKHANGLRVGRLVLDERVRFRGRRPEYPVRESVAKKYRMADPYVM